MKKRLFLFFVSIIMPIIGFAWKGDTTINGINYSLQYYPNDKEYWAEVTGGNPVSNLVIPDSIYFEGGLWDNNVGDPLQVKHNFAVIRISKNAFKDNTSLKSIRVGNNLKVIDESAFEGCINLSTVTISNLMTQINTKVFCGCTSLTSIILPFNLGGEEHFSGCENLKDVYVNFKIPFLISNNFASLSDDANYIYKNARLHVPKGSVERYKKEENWRKFKTIIDDIERSAGNEIEFADPNTETLCLLNWDTNKDGRLQKSEARSVESLGTVFKNQTRIQSFEELEFFTGLTSINDEAFMGDINLSTPIIPDHVTSIGNSAFENCGLIRKLEFPKGLTSIGDKAFKSVTLFKSSLPDGLKTVGEESFANCFSLIDVVIPASVTTIGSGAFNGCQFDNLFVYWTDPFAVDEPTFYTTRFANNYVYRYCRLHVPLGTKEKYQQTASWSNFNKIFEFYKDENNLIYEIPQEGKKLVVRGFDDIPNKVKIPSTVTIKDIDYIVYTVDYNAFKENIYLKEVSIPNSIKEIKDRAFEGCVGLEKIYVYDQNPINILSTVFIDVNYKTCILYVPVGSKEKYEQADGWKDFANIIEMEDNNPPVGDAEPYAVLSSDNTVLTFYYDDKKESRGGMSVKPFVWGNGVVNSGWYDQHSNITTVIFDASFANCTSLTSTSYWFKDCENLKTIKGLVNLRTENVTDMSSMFYGCSSLTSLDLNGFNTSKVKDMAVMFCGCSSLTSLDLSGFTTENVTNMIGVFRGCSGLTNVNLSGFKTDNVTTTATMFHSCSNLTNLDLSSFKTDNVTTTYAMFYGCSNLTSLDLSGFKTDNVKYMRQMFYGCSSIQTIYVNEDGWSTVNVTSGNEIFSGCIKLVGGNGTKYDANHTDVEYARIDKAGAPGYFTAKNGGTEPVGDGKPYVVYNDGTLSFYCDDQRSSREGTTYELNEGEEEPGWYENRSSVTKVFFDSSFATARPTTGHEWFDSCTQLTEIEGLEYLNTSEMTFMDEMFFFCRHLNNVDLSHFETNKVTSMRAMFSGCSGLKSIDLSHFDTRNVEILGAMFYGCSSLTEIDLSNFDTGKVTSFSFILRNCTSLKEVIMGQMFVSTEVANIDNAFEGCTSLKTIQFRGVIPSCINSNFFESVGTAEAPATLVVPKLYKDGYQDKFDGNMFYGGYFTLQERNAIEGDVDGDGEVTEEDIAEVEKVILNPSVGYDPNKDVNHDGVVNVADIVEEVNIINSTGKVEQVNSKVEASLTGCSRGDNGGILLTFTLKNVSGQDFGEVRVGHTGYYQNMEGSTDTGDEIHNLSVSIMSQNSGNWSDDVRFSFPANDTKSLMIGIDNVSATAKSLTLQVGVYCETWEVQNDVIKFVNIPIQ